MATLLLLSLIVAIPEMAKSGEGEGRGATRGQRLLVLLSKRHERRERYQVTQYGLSVDARRGWHGAPRLVSL
jgi:hypothetical protein